MRFNLNSVDLWHLPPEKFNEWRRKNDYPVIFSTFTKELPHFTEWMNSQKISKKLLFQHGIARFISTEDSLLLCMYKNDNEERLFEKKYKKLISIRKAGWLTKEIEYQPYFIWLKKNKGKYLYTETKKHFAITGWVNGKPKFMKQFLLLDLGNANIKKILLAGRLLDFVCLDNLKLTGAINNTYIHIWYSSAKGLEINGSVAFINFYKTKLWDSGYGDIKKELILRDGIFQDFHFKDCDLHFHAYRSKLTMWSVKGIMLEATLEHTDIFKSYFSTGNKVFGGQNAKKEYFEKIKTIYSSIGRFSDAGDYFYKEKRSEMLSMLTPHITYREVWHLNNLKQKFFLSLKCFSKFVSNFISFLIWGFGEKPRNSLLCSVAVIFLSALIYYYNSSSKTYEDFGTSTYYSLVTFVTLGYGDIAQNDMFLKLFSASEAFGGMILMGFFLAGYASKAKQY